jgi:hypothetical protein
VTKQYNNTETGEAPWIYPEFKGYHSNLYWSVFNGKDHSFTVTTSIENVFSTHVYACMENRPVAQLRTHFSGRGYLLYAGDL